MNITTAARVRKSEALSQDEMKSLKRFLKPFLTDVDKAEALDIGRNTISRVLGKGVGSPATIAKIRAAIKSEPQPAEVKG